MLDTSFVTQPVSRLATVLGLARGALPSYLDLRIFLAGPAMAGLPFWDVCQRATTTLRAYSFDVVSLAEELDAAGVDMTAGPASSAAITAAFVRTSTAAMLDCDAVAFLPGSDASSNVRSLYTVARSLGVPMFLVDPHDEEFPLLRVTAEQAEAYFSGWATAQAAAVVA